MPQLGLSSSISRGKARTPIKIYQNMFDTGMIGGWTNVSASHGLNGNFIEVTPSGTNGYVHRNFSVRGNTKYYWSVKTGTSHLLAGDKSILFGTAAGNGVNAAVIINGSNTYYSGSFTTGASQTTVHLALMVEVSGRAANFTNILLETYEG